MIQSRVGWASEPCKEMLFFIFLKLICGSCRVEWLSLAGFEVLETGMTDSLTMKMLSSFGEAWIPLSPFLFTTLRNHGENPVSACWPRDVLLDSKLLIWRLICRVRDPVSWKSAWKETFLDLSRTLLWSFRTLNHPSKKWGWVMYKYYWHSRDRKWSLPFFRDFIPDTCMFHILHKVPDW